MASLPRPLIDYRPGYEIEMNMLVLQFTALQNLERKDLTTKQWNELLIQLLSVGDVPGTNGDSDRTRWTTALNLTLGYPRAERLPDRPWTEEGRGRGHAAGPGCGALHDECLRGNAGRLFQGHAPALPGRQGPVRTIRRRNRKGIREEITPLGSVLLPALGKAKVAETRMPWILARLRIFEALRIYAAGHGGQLPERLSDIHEVPIPLNPFDDKPFTYRRDGHRAMLGCESGPANLPWHWEISMAP